MIVDAKQARESAPQEDDLKDEFDQLVMKVDKIPDVSGRELTGMVESITKDLTVWRDKQIEQLKNTEEGITKRSSSLDNIINTFEKLAKV